MKYGQLNADTTVQVTITNTVLKIEVCLYVKNIVMLGVISVKFSTHHLLKSIMLKKFYSVYYCGLNFKFLKVKMSIFRIVSLITSITFLAACASTPKPSMTDDLYKKAAMSIFIALRCGETGLASPSDALWGRRMTYFRMSDYTVNKIHLENELKNLRNTVASTPPSELCNRMAIEARDYQSMVESHNSSVDKYKSDMQQLINSSAPRKPIWCNTIGNQTFCN